MYKTEEEMKNDMLRGVDNTLNQYQNNFIHDAIAGTALELADSYMQLEYIAGKLDVENLFDEELDIFIYQRTGLIRKEAVKATGIVTITGEEDAVVAEGSLFSAGEIEFETIEEKIVGVGGEVDVKVRALTPGVDSNVPKMAINDFPTTISGLVSVTNKSDIKNGFNEESDVDYRERYYERIETPATSGNKYHYKIWAKEKTGVGDARIESLWDGDNTVKIRIVNSNKETADAELVEEVQEYIDPGVTGLGRGQAPIGAFATVVSADAKEISVTANVYIDDERDIGEVTRLVKENVAGYLREIAFVEEIVSYAKIGAAILATPSVVDYSDLTVNGAIKNIVVTDTEVAVIKGVDLVEELSVLGD